VAVIGVVFAEATVEVSANDHPTLWGHVPGRLGVVSATVLEAFSAAVETAATSAESGSAASAKAAAATTAAVVAIPVEWTSELSSSEFSTSAPAGVLMVVRLAGVCRGRHEGSGSLAL
jgi:hypothetical protein